MQKTGVYGKRKVRTDTHRANRDVYSQYCDHCNLSNRRRKADRGQNPASKLKRASRTMI